MPKEYFFRWLPTDSQYSCTQPKTEPHFAHFELISSSKEEVKTVYLCQHHLNKLALNNDDVKKAMLEPGSGVTEVNPSHSKHGPNIFAFKRP